MFKTKEQERWMLLTEAAPPKGWTYEEWCYQGIASNKMEEIEINKEYLKILKEKLHDYVKSFRKNK